MNIFNAFDALVGGSAELAQADRSIRFRTRKDNLSGAQLTLECGAFILHSAVGLLDDGVFQYPGLNEDCADDELVEVRVKLSLPILARLATQCRTLDRLWVRSNQSPFPLASFDRDELPDNFVTREYIRHVTGKFGRNHWWLDACFVRDGLLYAQGWAIPPQGWPGGPPQLKIDFATAEVFPARSEFASNAYWFLAGTDALGFLAVAPCRPDGAFSKIELAFELMDDVKSIRRFPIRQLVGTLEDLRLPIPPDEAIHRVSGPNSNMYSYINGGRTDFERFRSLILDRVGVSSLAGLRVLDWGVGCGRLARYFIEEGAEVWGADIDAKNIAWCEANFPGATFVKVDLMPPTSLPSDGFDVIISSSVLSHLTENAMDAWLGEINRLIRPEGVALLSFNGNGNSYLYCASYPPAIEKLDGYGFFDEWRTADLDGHVDGAEEYYRFTAMSDEKAKEIFSRHCKVESVVYGVVSMHQDIAVLRKQ